MALSRAPVKIDKAMTARFRRSISVPIRYRRENMVDLFKRREALFVSGFCNPQIFLRQGKIVRVGIAQA